MKTKTRFRKPIAWLLTLAMIFSMLPVSVFATEDIETDISETSTDVVCDCGTDDPAIHATTCAVYVAPENPVCDCAEKCTEVNEWCDVCGFDYTACTGTDRAVGYAEGDVASVTVGETTTNYTSLDDALIAAQNNPGSTLTLLQNIDRGSEELMIRSVPDSTFTIDLNGCTLTSTTATGTVFIQASVNLTVVDSKGTGGIISNNNAFYIDWNGTTVNIKGVTITVTSTFDYDACVYINNSSATVNIIDSTILSERVGVYGGGKLNISGDTRITTTSSNMAAIHRTGGALTITGGSITGGVYVDGGTADIIGGTITEPRDYYNAVDVKNAQVTISGGSISGVNADLCNVSYNPGTIKLTLDEGKTEGATFPGGITIEGNTLAELLATETATYWGVVDGKDTMLTVADDAATGITDKGDITIRAICDHSGNTSKPVDNENGTHSITCTVCQTAVTEDHTLTDGACTACDYVCPHSSFDSTTGICGDCQASVAIAKVEIGGTTTYYLMADALRTAVEDNKSDQAVTLLADIEILALRFFTENTTNTLNLNGHTLTGSEPNAVLIVAGGCELTITGTGSINFTTNTPLMSANYEGSRIVVGKDVTLNGFLRSANGGILELTGETIPEEGLTVILWSSGDTYNVSDVLKLTADYYLFVNGVAVHSYSETTEGTVRKHTDHSYTYTDNNDGTHKYECTICGDNVTEAHKGGTATCTEKAKCQHCSASYGEVDTTNHDSSVAFDSNGFCPNGCYQPAELNESGYYEIGNAGQLFWFAQQVNGGNGAINGKLTTNIVVNQNVLVNGALNSNTDGFRVWTPIGYWNSSEDLSYYVGTFDGAGFTVSGLYHNDSTKSSIGLFGTVSTNGIVKNVGVVDSYFCGEEEVGGVVGYIYEGTVQNCYNTGIVSGNTDVGGVVGYIYEGTVQNCYNMGTVRSDETTGGVVGLNWGGLVTNCHNTGAVKGGDETGGVVGYMISSSVELCYNTGTVNGKKYVGGIFGYGSGGNAKNCYNTGMVSGSTYVGGVVGYIGSGTVENCYNANSVSGSSSVGGVVGKRYDSKTGITTNSYFDSTKYSGSAIGGNDAGAATVEGKTTEQFASGEVAYLLGDAFGQNIGTESYPLLGGTKVYYGYNSCGDTEKKYTNDENTSEEKPAHTGEATYTLTEDGKQHIAKWSCCGTEVTENHTGGTATCTTQAVCENCGESYGELDPNNHEYEKNNGICCETYQPATLVTNENYASLGLNAEYVDYYAISNAGQLYWFANHINTVDRAANAVLLNDIDLEGKSDGTGRKWTPIGATGENSNNFRGVFDGQDHTITGLYVEGNGAGIGLFGEVRLGTVENFTIYGDVKLASDCNYVGGVIGSAPGANGTDVPDHNGATIRNITSYVNVILEEGSHGSSYVGGFIGYANHETIIENCSWYGTLDLGAYRADSGVGGLVGRLYDKSSVTIRNCGAYGIIKTSYKKGTHNNYDTIYIGGVLSYSPSGTQAVLENNLWAGEFIDDTDLGNKAHLSAFGTLNGEESVTNCYAIDSVPYITTENKYTDCITTVTAQQLTSGEVAYFLQGEQATEVWGQDLSQENSLPVLNGAKVYKYTDGHSNELKFGFAGYTTDGAIINIPTEGTYSLIFADYDGTRLNNIDVVPVTVTADTIGEITQASIKGVTIDTGDKIMLWQDMTNLVPLCEAYIVE